MTAMLNFKDGVSVDSDLVEDILVDQMMVGQPFRQGNLSGVRSVPKPGPNSFSVGIGIRGSKVAKSIAKDLTQADAVRLKGMIRDAIRQGGIVEVPLLVVAASEART